MNQEKRQFRVEDWEHNREVLTAQLGKRVKSIVVLRCIEDNQLSPDTDETCPQFDWEGGGHLSINTSSDSMNVAASAKRHVDVSEPVCWYQNGCLTGPVLIHANEPEYGYGECWNLIGKVLTGFDRLSGGEQADWAGIVLVFGELSLHVWIWGDCLARVALIPGEEARAPTIFKRIHGARLDSAE